MKWKEDKTRFSFNFPKKEEIQKSEKSDMHLYLTPFIYIPLNETNFNGVPLRVT